MPAPVIAADTPPAWVTADVERPPIASSTGATWSSWRAARSADDRAAMVAACIEAPVPGWVEDMKPPFVARTVAIAGATAERIVGSPVETFDAGATLGLRPVGASAPVLGAARTFLGFDASNAVTCFVVCAARGSVPNETAAACNEVTSSAHLDGGDPPPRAGVVLRLVTWAVHRPRPVAIGFGSLAVLAGIAAVATRRRPRART